MGRNLGGFGSNRQDRHGSNRLARTRRSEQLALQFRIVSFCQQLLDCLATFGRKLRRRVTPIAAPATGHGGHRGAKHRHLRGETFAGGAEKEMDPQRDAIAAREFAVGGSGDQFRRLATVNLQHRDQGAPLHASPFGSTSNHLLCRQLRSKSRERWRRTDRLRGVTPAISLAS